jgi:hypothetical protein
MDGLDCAIARLGDRGDGGAGAKSGKKLTAFHLVLPEGHQTSKRRQQAKKCDAVAGLPSGSACGENGTRSARAQETRWLKYPQLNSARTTAVGHPSTHQHRAVEQSVAVYLLTHIMIGEEV